MLAAARPTAGNSPRRHLMPNKILRILIGLEECFRKWKLDDKVFLFLLTTVSCGHDTANCKLPSWVHVQASLQSSTARVPCLTGCWQEECNKLTTPNTLIGTVRSRGELQKYSCWFKSSDQIKIGCQKKAFLLDDVRRKLHVYVVGCVICFHLKALR